MRSTGVQQLPRLPRLSDKLPRLDNLLRQEPPLSTSYQDALPPLTFLDPFQPTDFQPLDERYCLADGKWRIPDGGLFEIRVQSFCGRCGSYPPHATLGYLPAPYKGSRAKLLQAIMQRYQQHPELEQRDVQWLVWAILAQAKPETYTGAARRAAQVLLTEQELRSLNQQGLDAFQDEVMRRLLPQVREALRPVLEVENRVRQLVAQVDRSFEELERVVMRPIDPNDRILYEPNHWYWEPDQGFFYRYRPQGYSRTHVQVWVPRPVEAVYDALGRIERMEQKGRWSIAVEYDPTITPWRCPEDPNLLAYAFRRVLIAREDLGLRESIEVEGWLFAHDPQRKARGGVLVATRSLAGVLQEQSRFGQWMERIKFANKMRNEVMRYVRWGRWAERTWKGERSLDPLMDKAHYARGISAALSGTPADRIHWIAETHRNTFEGLAYALRELRSLPTGSEPTFDPFQSVGTPGSQGGQRILTSGRRAW